MIRRLTVVFAVLFLLEYVQGNTTRVRKEEALRKSLLENYNKDAIPQEKNIITLNGIDIRRIEMNEEEHTMVIHCWLQSSWKDPRLSWDADDHGGISQLSISDNDLWQPDFTTFLAAEGGKVVQENAGVYMIVYPDGKVLYVPPRTYHSVCVMDLTYWPHDAHNCSLIVGSWVYSGLVMDLDMDNFVVKVSLGVPEYAGGKNDTLQDWEITKTTAYRRVKQYECCEEPYISFKVDLQVTRHAPVFAWTVKMPAVCLCLLTLVMFLLPPGAIEKVLFGALCLILNFLYINYTSTAVNHVPSHTPLIIQLVCQQIVLVLVSIFVSAVVVRMARTPHTSGIPPYLKKTIGGLARFLCLGNYANLKQESTSIIKSDEVELGSEAPTKGENENASEWIILAAIVDRLAFLLYLAICLITLIRFCSIL